MAAVAKREVEKAARGPLKEAFSLSQHICVPFYSEPINTSDPRSGRNYFRVPATQELPGIKGERQRLFVEGVQVRFLVDVGVHTELMGLCYELQGMNGAPMQLVDTDEGRRFSNAVVLSNQKQTAVLLGNAGEVGMVGGKGPFAIDDIGGGVARMNSADGGLFGCQLSGSSCKPLGKMKWRVGNGPTSRKVEDRIFRMDLSPGNGAGAGSGIEWETYSIEVYCRLGCEVVKEADDEMFLPAMVLLFGVRSKGSSQVPVQCGNVRQTISRVRYRGPY